MNIIKESILKVADNSGARRVRCIGMYNNRKYARLGDIIMVSIRAIYPKSSIKNGEKYLAMIIRTKYGFNRGPFRFRFNDNAVVILNSKFKPVGNRIFGASVRDLRDISQDVVAILEKTY